MSIKSYSLTTAQRAADFAGLGTLTGTKLTVMERLVDSVTESIESYLGFRVQKTTYTREEYSTEYGQTLSLKTFPIVSDATFLLERRTSALNEDEWETIDQQYYHIDEDTGIIQGASGWGFSRTRNGFRVTYTAGYDFDNSDTFLGDTKGGDIELAAWILLESIYNRRKGTGVISEKIGDYSVRFKGAIFQSEDVQSLLDKYAKQDELSVITPLQE